jgi:hypothetical protein
MGREGLTCCTMQGGQCKEHRQKGKQTSHVHGNSVEGMEMAGMDWLFWLDGELV